MDERFYWYWLSNIEGIGSVTTRKLIDIFKRPSLLFQEKAETIAKLGILKGRAWENFAVSRTASGCKQLETGFRRLKSAGITFITIDDENYPDRLKHLYDKPYSLYLKGRLPDEAGPAAAIIGARRASFQGLEIAAGFGRVLGRAGIQVISGMAAGIDGAGQMGALEAGGYSLGVLGCGVDICYPRENRRLYEGLLSGGGVLSEFPPGSPPMAGHFPMRNRIISGLADCVVVIEARERSGSLITVDLALEQGKEVFAIPGRITDECSKGCNRLISAGASVLHSPEDILDFFGWDRKKNVNFDKNEMLILAQGEKLLYSCLNLEPKHIEDIALEAGMDLMQAMNLLAEFERRQLIHRIGSNYFAIKYL